MESLHLQQSDAHWDHEPKVQSPRSAGVLAGVLQLENLAGKDAGAPKFMGRAGARENEAVDLDWYGLPVENQTSPTA